MAKPDSLQGSLDLLIRKDTGRRARIYGLTAVGKKQLAAEESRWHTATSAVNRILRTV